MNVLLLNTSDLTGGAARAAYRLHQGFQGVGVASQMLVQEKFSDDKTVIAPKTRLAQGMARTRLTFDALPLKFYPHRENTTFSLQWLRDGIVSKVTQLNPDIIHLHWVNQSYIRIETIAKFHKPIVWTLHDMWPFTGGCHYSEECDRYTASCGTCPQLNSSNDWDLSRWVWQRKAQAWKNLNLTIVTPSKWLAECVKASTLFKDVRVEIIPHGLDTYEYRPVNRSVARELFKLPQDKKIVLFGAISPTSNPRKGFHLLQLALQKLSQSGWREKIELVIFGVSQVENSVDLGFKFYCVGQLHDDVSLAVLYSAADVMVVPSTQESFGQTAFESLACGTPVVCFDSTGLKDIVEHQKNGYRAKCFSCDDLANGIAWVLENPERHQKLSERAREKVEQEFTLELQASRYSSLFMEILEGGKH
jgi:glycosyltransferase involved in cell wall biosynthesis